MKVLELMRVHVNTIGPAATLPEAVDMMDLYQVVTVPVVDADGNPLGVITESDIEDALLIPYEAAASALPSPSRQAGLVTVTDRARLLTVASVMSSPAVCIDEDTDVVEAASLMLSHGYKRLPVTSRGRVVGMVGRTDICQGLLSQET